MRGVRGALALHAPHDATGGARRRSAILLAVLCTAQMILAIDTTVVNVANATIKRELGFTAADLQWTITSYALTFGGFLLLGGRMADLFGRRRLFLLGMTAFALASLGAGLAQNTVELISARALQGLCAAVVSPTVLALLAAAYPDGRRRQRAYGIWATAGSFGGMTGFLLGGIVTGLLGWRWIFFINLPLCTLAVLGTFVLLPADEPSGLRRRLDLPGAVTVTAALALVIYGLGEAQSTSWSSPHTVVALACAPALLVIFAVVERRSAEPLLPVSVLHRRASVGNVIAVLQQSMAASTAFLTPLFMQEVWGYSAERAGVSTLAIPIGFMIGTRLTTRLVAHFSPRRIVGVGLVFITAGLAWLARTSTHVDYATTFLPALAVRSIGQGLVTVPVVLTVTAGVPKRDEGVAAGLYNMSQQLGGALGLAAIATVAAAASASARSAGHVGAEAHGIRVAFLVCAAIGAFSTVFSLATLGGRPGDARNANAPEPLVGGDPEASIPAGAFEALGDEPAASAGATGPAERAR